jgi:hypothetical protein
MDQSGGRLSFGFKKRLLLTGASLLMLTALVPVQTSAATAGLLTTSMVPSNAAQTTQLGVPGAGITYSSVLASPEPVFVFGSILNQAGQTVSFSVQGSTVQAGGSATFFFGIPSGLHGNLKVVMFVTTLDMVPLSVSTTVAVTA